MLLAAPDARAGSYSGPVYSGGELDSTTTSGVMFGPPRYYSGSPWGQNGGLPGTADCNGAITTTFTWVPAAGQTITTDPPPANVIVEETSHASATGTNVSLAGSPAITVTGTCNNGLVPNRNL